ncbi:MAG: hypothetical protein VCC01_00735 [Candidatus Hydrogenedentota bacterium]
MRFNFFACTLVLSVVVSIDTDAEDSYTFYKDVAPILQENCQECHRPAGANFGGMIAPMSLIRYEEVRPWAKSIIKQIQSREMPPWDADAKHKGQFRNERTLEDSEIALITQWVDSGAPRGNPKDAPVPRTFEAFEGWMIGEPDLIVAMPEPYHVSDDVYDQYTAFSVDLSDGDLPEDVWITSFQCKPGSKIIHHFNCHLLPPTDGKLPPARDKPESSTISPQGAGSYIGGISSGSDPVQWPEGFGIPLKRGTRVTFDIHYHKEAGPGTAVDDLSHIGFTLTDEKPVRELGGSSPMMHFNINIAPGQERYKIGPISQILEDDIEVIGYMPHMHMRGKEAKFEAIYPDGTEEVLLYVPRYDFAWQTVYYNNVLKVLPKGTKVQYTAWYDNSEPYSQQRGFDSNETVRFGQKSSDEMMMGFMISAKIENTEPD